MTHSCSVQAEEFRQWKKGSSTCSREVSHVPKEALESRTKNSRLLKEEKAIHLSLPSKKGNDLDVDSKIFLLFLGCLVNSCCRSVCILTDGIDQVLGFVSYDACGRCKDVCWGLSSTRTSDGNTLGSSRTIWWRTRIVNSDGLRIEALGAVETEGPRKLILDSMVTLFYLRANRRDIMTRHLDDSYDGFFNFEEKRDSRKKRRKQIFET